MTGDELYALGYSLQYAPWGVSVYRTINGEAEPSDAAVEGVATIHFPDGPVSDAEAIRRGWEFAAANFVQRRLA